MSSAEDELSARQEKRMNEWHELEVKMTKVPFKEQVADISVHDIRNYISKLTVMCFFPEFKKEKPRGLWLKKKPDEWPSSLPFQDPHNKGTGGAKLKKADLVRMLIFLIKTFRKNRGLPYETLEIPEQPTDACVLEFEPSQPGINPVAPASLKPRVSVEVSSSQTGATPGPSTTPSGGRRYGVQLAGNSGSEDAYPNEPRRSWDIIDRLITLNRTRHIDTDLSRKLNDSLVNINNPDKQTLRLLHNIAYYLQLDSEDEEKEDQEEFHRNVCELESMLKK